MTITTSPSNQVESIKNLKNKKEKISLLSALKKVPTSLRTSELLKLIGENKKEEKLEVPKWDIASKAIIISFPKGERYSVLKLLKNNFDIQLTAPQIESLKTCLLEDPSFYKLLPFTQKKFLESFLTQPIGKKITSSRAQALIQSKINASKVSKENHIQDFLRKFSCKNKNDQINLFLQFQQSKPKFLTEYLKSAHNIIELFRCISETSLSCYFKLPIIDYAIDKALFSWDHVLSMLKTFDNRGVYLFIDHLLTRNKITETIDIEQLKLLLLGKDFEKRLDFFNMLKAKQLIPSEITASDIKLVELFPNLEDQLNNNIQQRPLFFINKAQEYKRSLAPIEEECDESNSKKSKLEANRYLSRRI